MPNELARRIFLFRAHAGEMLRDGDAALSDWLRHDYHLEDSPIIALTCYLQEQETVSEIPMQGALSIECVAMQSFTEYFLHTPLSRAANEAIARAIAYRSKAKQTFTQAADLGLFVMTFEGEPIGPDAWRARLASDGFVEDSRAHLQKGDLLARHFGQVAHTGLMVLRHPAGRKRKVGGSAWPERRLFEQIQQACPDFILLRQAEREAMSAADVAGALAYLRELASLPIRVRHLPRPSPFGESLLQMGLPPSIGSGPVHEAQAKAGAR
jgi:Lhr-like helicase